MPNWTKEDFLDHLKNLTDAGRAKFVADYDAYVPPPKPTGRLPLPRTQNKTEAAYAQHLELLRIAGDILYYGFEVVKVKVGHDCWLTPDFLIMNRDGSLALHDTKGATKTKGKQPEETYYAEEDAVVKARSVGAGFPIPMFFVFRRHDGEWEKREM